MPATPQPATPQPATPQYDDATALRRVERDVVACARCPRLVASRREAALHPPPRFAGEEYWARPVPGFGDPEARLYVLGLATSAHGGNRTGRAFTGNPTADWLGAALHRAGFANRPVSAHRGDGYRLDGAWLASAVRCPPPGNRPTAAERDACLPYFDAELRALPTVSVVLTLGAFAWDAACRQAGAHPRPAFAHGACFTRPDGRVQLASYHPSRQNTATGRLTRPMLDHILSRARTLTAPPP
ncbi:uracil-DNA glycosylase [Streptomyces sp. NPDC047002]|uniref:uracil-DNA glycosylase n=1 Tax=Streptomyces sp. NPDC047002 TaxID=3155475 RepID=UPI003454A69B